MKSLRTFMVAMVAASVIALVARAEDKPADKGANKDAGFEKIKALAGDWEVTKGPAEHGPKSGTVSYKVTAGGSAVLETLFAGTDHEMVTMYYMDGDKLELTHYCMLQNRPHMLAEPQTSPDTIVFKCPEGDKLEKEQHMHGVTFTFVDADHLKTDWVLYKDGKSSGSHGFELTRKKKAD